jgi:hypothetical protein
VNSGGGGCSTPHFPIKDFGFNDVKEMYIYYMGGCADTPPIFDVSRETFKSTFLNS